MKKRAIDLTFDELAVAGREAAAIAITESHAAGLSTWSVTPDGTFVETYPDGAQVSHTRKAAESMIIGKTGEKRMRGKAAA
jgi:hypothetical protein